MESQGSAGTPHRTPLALDFDFYRFLMDSRTLLGPSVGPLWSQNRQKVGKMALQIPARRRACKKVRKRLLSEVPWDLENVVFAQEGLPKSTFRPSRKKEVPRLHSGGLLGAFWAPLGTKICKSGTPGSNKKHIKNKRLKVCNLVQQYLQKA